MGAGRRDSYTQLTKWSKNMDLFGPDTN